MQIGATVGTISCICDDCGSLLVYCKSDTLTERQKIRDRFERDLCLRCISGRITGFYEFRCVGCGQETRSDFWEAAECLNCSGNDLCRECQCLIRGVYDEKNIALMHVLSYVLQLPINGSYIGPDKIFRMTHADLITREEYENFELSYMHNARKETKRMYKKNKNIINPKNLFIGSAKSYGTYQVDHIVPLTVCARYNVPISSAVDVNNLGLMPARANVLKYDNFSIRRLVNVPKEIVQKLDKIYARW